MPTIADDVDERPIIFNEWSINRIPPKCQTRRLLHDEVQEALRAMNGETTDPHVKRGDTDPSPLRFFHTNSGHSGAGWYVCLKEYPSEGARYIGPCPYGTPGDILWVREAFRLPAEHDELSPSDYIKNRDLRSRAYDAKYVADGTERQEPHPDYPIEWGRKRPSIHMPRELCRLHLRVEDVSVERLQEISQEDAIAEGIEEISGYGWTAFDKRGYDDSPKLAFRYLWNDLHGEGAWEENPWIWAVDFETIN